MSPALVIRAATVAEIETAHRTIVDILDAPAGDKAKVAALEALGRLVGVRNVTVQNCQFTTTPDLLRYVHTGPVPTPHDPPLCVNCTPLP